MYNARMKIIFLDIDGVLTTLSTKWQTFHPDCVKALKRVLDVTDAKIVLSSAWRHGFIDWRTENHCLVDSKNAINVMKELFTDCGLPADSLIGKTPFNLSEHRGKEISEWLKRNEASGVESFVVLDDDSDIEPFQDRFVQTHPDNGMDEENADKAISLLTLP